MSKKLLLINFQQAGESQTFVANTELYFDDVLMTKGAISVNIEEGDDRDAVLRKLADKDIEIFLDGESIGFGALNFGQGMTAEQLEHDASTPEAD